MLGASWHFHLLEYSLAHLMGGLVNDQNASADLNLHENDAQQEVLRRPVESALSPSSGVVRPGQRTISFDHQLSRTCLTSLRLSLPVLFRLQPATSDPTKRMKV